MNLDMVVWSFIIGVWLSLALRFGITIIDNIKDKRKEKRIKKIIEEHHKKFPSQYYGGVPAFPLSHEFEKENK